MDDRRSEPLTDEALAREIEAALDMAPSPDFVARVRSRLRGESARSPRWNLRWPWLAGAAATTILVLALGWERPPGVHSPTTRASDPTVRVAPVSPQPENVPLPQARALPSTAAPVAQSGGTVRRAAMPDVQVSEAEVAGFQLFVASARSGRINGSLFGETTATPADVQPFQEIAIPPIAIEPLEPVELVHGDQS